MDNSTDSIQMNLSILENLRHDSVYHIEYILWGWKKKCNQKQLGLSITPYSLRGVKYVLTSKHYSYFKKKKSKHYSFNYEPVIGK